MEKRSHHVIRLLQNQQYPTYQLYAEMANKRLPPGTACGLPRSQPWSGFAKGSRTASHRNWTSQGHLIFGRPPTNA